MRNHLRTRYCIIATISFAGLISAARADDIRIAQTTQQVDTQEAKTTERWEAIYMQGNKIGYRSSSSRTIEEDGRKLVKISSTAKLTISRLGQKIEMSLEAESIETPAGEVVRVLSKTALGPTPTVARGQVKGGKMHLEVSTQGKTTKTVIPWSKEYRGFFGDEQTLQQRPLRPGERRRFKGLIPIFNRVAEIELSAEDFEKTKLLDAQRKLLKITSTTDLGLAKLQATIWADADGHVVKTFEPTMRQETYATTKEQALAGIGEANLDLIVNSIVKLKGRLKAVHNAREVRYRVTLKKGKPGEVFPRSTTQTVKPSGGVTAELTVRDARAAGPAGRADKTRPGAEYVNANNWIQSDDAAVKAMAAKVAPDEQDTRKLAVALERSVHDSITEKDFSTALATAAEVAKTRQGDCTEHAVLLAALARARGIPARVVVGLVYVQSLGGFGYHMWNEVYVDGRWLPLDATRARGGTGTGHIQLAHSSLDKAGGTSLFLPVLQVIGQLSVEVLEVSYALPKRK